MGLETNFYKDNFEAVKSFNDYWVFKTYFKPNNNDKVKIDKTTFDNFIFELKNELNSTDTIYCGYSNNDKFKDSDFTELESIYSWANELNKSFNWDKHYLILHTRW